MNRKLPDIVSHPLDVLWDGFGMADLCWPPPLQSRRGKGTEGKEFSESLQIHVLKSEVSESGGTVSQT